MCGIIGYTGGEQAAPILLAGLTALEYRGYDSAGIAVFKADGSVIVEKCEGRLAALADKLKNRPPIEGTAGIGHTRWATHGEPSDINAHPHTAENVTVVHNGIIENYMALKAMLTRKGYVFVSDTDSEVIAHLCDYYYDTDPVEALSRLTKRLKGSFAIGVMFADRPGNIYAVRKDTPLIVGLSDCGSFIASDVPAILRYTRDIYLLDEEEIVELTPTAAYVYNTDGERVEKTVVTVDWDPAAAEKGGYEHFMFKEIMEQPKALRDTINPRIAGGCVDLGDIGLSAEYIGDVDKIYVVACGSAYYVSVAAKYVIESVTGISVEADIASEFRYRGPIISTRTLVVIISQSGETADSMAALREAKRRGARTLAIVNVVGSSIAREAASVLYTWAGPEIAVATTKAFSAQLAVVYTLAAHIAGCLGKPVDTAYIEGLSALPQQVEKLVGAYEDIQYYASKFYNTRDCFFMGRGLDYAAALEGALKLKELSYIHAEPYAAGELKHGPISLIERGSLIVAIATQERLFDKTLSNIKEVKARGAVVLLITTEDNTQAVDVADYVYIVPKVHGLLSVSAAIVPLQLFSYYIAVMRGCDVDKPRNLAKSVVVE